MHDSDFVILQKLVKDDNLQIISVSVHPGQHYKPGIERGYINYVVSNDVHRKWKGCPRIVVKPQNSSNTIHSIFQRLSNSWGQGRKGAGIVFQCLCPEVFWLCSRYDVP